MKYILFMSFLLFIACQKSKDYQLVNNTFFHADSLLGNPIKQDSLCQYVLIIPMEGCSGCKEKALLFSNKYVHNKKLKTVLSTMQGKAFLQVHLLRLNEKDMYLLDPKGYFIRQARVGQYPTLYEIKNKYIISEKELYPEVITKEIEVLEKNL
ncbi:hypothetical protein [Hugenholtzia roseola]|uniref:hypothetical protein n=1 Tax=Hugenholtzia roseola TaxID=1002 RepID=UPI000478BBAD|nr:hypothetical protein [Hugenholtzia roseola]